MEASYPVDRVILFAGTNKRSVYMEPSYSCMFTTLQLHEVPQSSVDALLAKIPAKKFPSKAFTCFSPSFPPLSTGNSPRRITRLRHVNISPRNL